MDAEDFNVVFKGKDHFCRGAHSSVLKNYLTHFTLDTPSLNRSKFAFKLRDDAEVLKDYFTNPRMLRVRSVFASSDSCTDFVSSLLYAVTKAYASLSQA
jgi:hypothetical protein